MTIAQNSLVVLKKKIKIKIKFLFMYFLFYFSGGGTSNSADGIQTRVNSPYTIEQMQRNGSLTNRKMSVQVGAWWMNFFSQNGIPVGKTDGFSNWISINVIFLPTSLFSNFWGLTVQNITSPFTPARTHSISGLKYWAPSEIAAKLPGQFSHSGQILLHWAAATLKGLGEF